MIAKRGVLKRSEPNAGLGVPAKASDAFRASRLVTASRRAVFRRLDFVASSVAMVGHRSAPSSLPANEIQLVMRASGWGVMS